MKRVIVFLVTLTILVSSCVFSDSEINDPNAELSFPENFNFKTSKSVTLETTGEPGVIKVYLNDEEQTYLGSYANGSGSVLFEVPDLVDELMLTYTDGWNSQFITRSAFDGETISWNVDASANSSGRVSGVASGCQDVLYAVENSFGGFWAIDVTNDQYDEFTFPNLQGGGSIACALDQESNAVYYNVGRTLYKFDLVDSTFSTVFTSNPFNGNYPRFTYNDGKFYMSNGAKMYIVDATTNQVLNQIDIQGFINNSSGGDIDFTTDGTLYLSCFSGLYKFTDIGETTATIERISAENFPYQLTSMAIDRQDRIFVGTNDANSKLIQMNKEDGSFEIVRTYNHKINDLAAWRCSEQDLSQIDTDDDGVPDVLDDYPDDPETAFDVFTPSELGYGTLAFEDMWPAEGDYDYNDMVINYKYISVFNSDNEAVRMQIKLKAVAAGASFKNGFGIELPIGPSRIASVEGLRLTDGLVSLAANGTEVGQTNAVIIPFDNVFSLFGGGSLINTQPSKGLVDPVEVDLVLHFTTPVPAAELSGAPFNPFIFTNADRSQEVHLRNHQPTALANTELFQTADDQSDLAAGKTYVSNGNVPWAINLIHNFRYPVEKTRIDGAYNYFVTWGQSEGLQYKDWYKDNNGYRQDNKLVFVD